MIPLEMDSVWLLKRLKEDFPGLWPDSEEEINGGDLVDFLCYQINELDTVKEHI